MTRVKGEKARVRGVRFPIDIEQWLAESARDSVRSFSSEVVFRLRRMKDASDAGKDSVS